MQVEATCENGRLEFARRVRLKHARVRLIVDIPDDEILHEDTQTPPEPSTEPPAKGGGPPGRDVNDAILKPWLDHLATLEPLSKDARPELFAKEWEARHCADD